MPEHTLPRLPEEGGAPSALPRHIAVIMDGNGRWATRRGLNREEGHRAGARAVRLLLEECRALNIPYVTVYAFSKENWKRPPGEIGCLFDLFGEFVGKQLPEMIRQGISLGVIGDKDDLPFTVRRLLDYAIQRSAGGGSMRFTLALSYSGRDEIVRAARVLAASGLRPEDMDEAAFRACLYAPDLPDPDLVIRTSGEMRISNFLLFECAYSEFFFTDTLWPDFDRAALRQALDSFAGRSRRFGRTDAQLEADNDSTETPRT